MIGGTYAEREPKIEEVRIQKTESKKKTTIVSKDEEKQKVIPLTSKKSDYEWVEGNEDIRYKIDKLTGNLDKKDIWYAGTDDIRSKIDKISKKHKKKNKDN